MAAEEVRSALTLLVIGHVTNKADLGPSGNWEPCDPVSTLLTLAIDNSFSVIFKHLFTLNRIAIVMYIFLHIRKMFSLS